MRKKERYEKILAWFRENRPIAETELHYNNPYELLIAVILSGQYHICWTTRWDADKRKRYLSIGCCPIW